MTSGSNLPPDSAGIIVITIVVFILAMIFFPYWITNYFKNKKRIIIISGNYIESNIGSADFSCDNGYLTNVRQVAIYGNDLKLIRCKKDK